MLGQSKETREGLFIVFLSNHNIFSDVNQQKKLRHSYHYKGYSSCIIYYCKQSAFRKGSQLILWTNRLHRIQGTIGTMYHIVPDTDSSSTLITSPRTLNSGVYVRHHSCGVADSGEHTTMQFNCIETQKADKEEGMTKRTSLPQTSQFRGLNLSLSVKSKPTLPCSA